MIPILNEAMRDTYFSMYFIEINDGLLMNHFNHRKFPKTTITYSNNLGNRFRIVFLKLFLVEFSMYIPIYRLY